VKRTHIPVLVNEFLAFFQSMHLSIFVDGTLGLGGHAKAILEEHPEIERFIGIDRDPQALEIASQFLESWKDKIEMIHGNYADLAVILKQRKILCVDGIFLDVGVSSMQLDQGERGFSFLREGPLDMRMDPSDQLSAETVVNRWNEKELGKIFRELGEEPRWKKVAKTIVIARRKKRIETTADLVAVLQPILGGRRRKKLHPATLVFQALRIYVNREIESLQKGMQVSGARLCPGGKLGVITFHRLEDRVVKQQLRENDILEVLTKKPIRPELVEIRENRRARSAKMRFAKKVSGGSSGS